MDYSDIINLPHHVSKVHPRMSIYQRAAQFAPFAALTGHDAAIRETARLTDSQIELGDENTEILNRRMSVIRQHLKESPVITVTFFQPDDKKAGGVYEIFTGCIRNIDDYEQQLVMTDGRIIPFSSVLDIQGKLFERNEENSY